jgi:hypothetical protein
MQLKRLTRKPKSSGEVSATASRSSTAGGGSGLSSKPRSTENLPSLAVDATCTTLFPVGPCLLASHCFAPTHELQKNCLGCGKYIHILCGRVLEEDDVLFPADSVVCLGCYPKTRGEMLSSLHWKMLMPTRKLKHHLPTCQHLRSAEHGTAQSVPTKNTVKTTHIVASGLYSPVQILPATRSFIVYALSIS